VLDTGKARVSDARPILRHRHLFAEPAVRRDAENAPANFDTDRASDTARRPGTPDHSDAAAVYPHKVNHTSHVDAAAVSADYSSSMDLGEERDGVGFRVMT